MQTPEELALAEAEAEELGLEDDEFDPVSGNLDFDLKPEAISVELSEDLADLEDEELELDPELGEDEFGDLGMGGSFELADEDPDLDLDLPEELADLEVGPEDDMGFAEEDEGFGFEFGADVLGAEMDLGMAEPDFDLDAGFDAELDDDFGLEGDLSSGFEMAAAPASSCLWYRKLAARYLRCWRRTRNRKCLCYYYRAVAAFYRCYYRLTRRRHYLCLSYLWYAKYQCCLYRLTKRRIHLCLCYLYRARYYCCRYALTKKSADRALCRRYRLLYRRCRG